MGEINTSRYSTATVKRRDGRVHRIDEPEGCSAAIIRTLGSYHLLDAQAIQALTGFGPSAIRASLRALKRAPNLYIKVADEQREDRNIFVKDCYELTKRGHDWHTNQGIVQFYRTERSNSSKHDMRLDRMCADLEVGSKKHPEIEISWGDEVIAFEKTPETTRDSKTPFAIPIAYQFDREPRKSNVRPDIKIFRINRTHLPKGKLLFCVGEYDNNSESVETRYFNRSSLATKFIEYLEILKQNRYAEYYGISSFRILFAFSSRARERSAIEILNKVALERDASRFLNCFFFKTYDKEAQKKPLNGHMLTEAWERGNGQLSSLME